MRECPFQDCGAMLPDNLFACRKHWYAISGPDRKIIHAAYDDYMNDRIGIEKLRCIQDDVLSRADPALR